jgi:hypothetical protein
VRPSGTVGGDDAALVSRLPALPSAGTEQSAEARDAGPARQVADRETGVPMRSADDSDLGWGGGSGDSNDDRLQRDKPPHW